MRVDRMMMDVSMGIVGLLVSLVYIAFAVLGLGILVLGVVVLFKVNGLLTIRLKERKGATVSAAAGDAGATVGAASTAGTAVPTGGALPNGDAVPSSGAAAVTSSDSGIPARPSDRPTNAGDHQA